MKGLNAFITEILRNPYLRHDSAVNEFLTQSNKSAWDKYKKVGVAGSPTTSCAPALVPATMRTST